MGVVPENDGEVKSSDFIAIGIRCGLSVRETLHTPVGLVMDLWEIYKMQHGIAPEE